jgi:hypothetical protein
MSDTPDLSAIEQRARRMLELLDEVRPTSLDFDNREHLQVIGLCLDMAIDRVEKKNEHYPAMVYPELFLASIYSMTFIG